MLFFLKKYGLISVSLMQMKLKVSNQKSDNILSKLVDQDSELEMFLSWVYYKKDMVHGTKLWEIRKKHMIYKYVKH